MFEHTNSNPLECYGNMLNLKGAFRGPTFCTWGSSTPNILNKNLEIINSKPYIFRLIFVCLKMCSFCNTKIQVANDIQEICSAKDM